MFKLALWREKFKTWCKCIFQQFIGCSMHLNILWRTKVKIQSILSEFWFQHSLSKFQQDSEAETISSVSNKLFTVCLISETFLLHANAHTVNSRIHNIHKLYIGVNRWKMCMPRESVCLAKDLPCEKSISASTIGTPAVFCSQWLFVLEQYAVRHLLFVQHSGFYSKSQILKK